MCYNSRQYYSLQEGRWRWTSCSAVPSKSKSRTRAAAEVHLTASAWMSTEVRDLRQRSHAPRKKAEKAIKKVLTVPEEADPVFEN